MNIKGIVENHLVLKGGVYFVDGHKEFSYSDGDAEEKYIHRAILKAKDVTSKSRELESYIRDWPSRYHLSRERALAYESLDIPSGAKILEIGCGCGSITRLLGEKSSYVIALEGSPRRAFITRERVRDLESVSVLCASFEDVIFKTTFDIVICNGVLEYSSLFVKHAEPAQYMLDLISPLVNSSGSLIVAIENKFGLRYFSSGKEEHTNIMFDGIEGYARNPSGPRTFGFHELNNLLREEFSSVETFLPLPDYKLPIAIIRADILDRVNCAELYAHSSGYDFGSFVPPHMIESLVWHELDKNKLLKHFSNSFFMIAGNEASGLIDSKWMGDIYSIKRNKQFTTRTRVYIGSANEVRVKKEYLESDGVVDETLPFCHRLNEALWLDGTSVHTLVVCALTRKERMSLEDRIREPVNIWWNAIKDVTTHDGKISGKALDWNWENAIRLGKKNQGNFIDKEWVWKEPIDPIWLIYRTVYKFVKSELYYSHRWDDSLRSLNTIKLLRAVARITGVSMNYGSVRRAVFQEIEFQTYVSGRKSGWIIIAWIYLPLKLIRIFRVMKLYKKKYVRKIRRASRFKR